VLSASGLRFSKPAPIARNALNKLKSRISGGHLISSSSVTQLEMPTDSTSLKAVVNAGTITKSTGTEISWQAADDTSNTVKLVHTKYATATGITSGRTWLYDVSDWKGLDEWMKTYPTEVAMYATIDTENGWAYWKLDIADIDEPSDEKCDKFLAAIGDGDLSTALTVLSKFYTQDIYITDTGLQAMKVLQKKTTLLSERLDTQCLGYKYFSYFETPDSNPWSD